MNRALQFTIFFSIFFTFLLLFNFYIFSHIAFMLRLPYNIWFWIFILFSSMVFILAMALDAQYGNGATKVYYVASAIWMGGLFITLFILIGYDILRHMIEIDSILAGKIIIPSVIAMTAAGAVNARFIRIKEIEIPSRGLNNNNMTIAHLSDLHLGAIHGTDYLKKIVDKTNSLKPDLVLITGDLADSPRMYSKDYFIPLNKLNAPAFFSVGNHEYYTGLEEIIGLLKKTKVKVLRNEKVELKDLQIIGLDYEIRGNALSASLSALKINPKKYSIMMYHPPLGLLEANKHGIDLILSGHTHGGQFFPFTMIAVVLWRKSKGLYQKNGTYQYISPGTGTWGPPLRLGTNNEITLIKLVEAK